MSLLSAQQVAELRQNVQTVLELRRARRSVEGHQRRALRLAAVDARHEQAEALVAQLQKADDRTDHTLQPTPLVHEVYIRLVGQRRVKSVFVAAIERPESERAAFLRSETSGDEAFCRELESLLRADAEAAVHRFLGTVARIVKVNGFVNAVPEFTAHPAVMNGCSDLFVAVFGERGRHARTSIGVASTPNQIPVEIDAVVEIPARTAVAGGADFGPTRLSGLARVMIQAGSERRSVCAAKWNRSDSSVRIMDMTGLSTMRSGTDGRRWRCRRRQRSCACRDRTW